MIVQYVRCQPQTTRKAVVILFACEFRFQMVKFPGVLDPNPALLRSRDVNRIL